MKTYLFILCVALGFSSLALADGEKTKNLALLVGDQTTPNSGAVYGFSFNQVRGDGWGGGLQITYQPYSLNGATLPIYQLDLDSVYYFFGEPRGPYLGITGGVNWTPTPINNNSNVFGNLGGLAGWDLRLAEHLSIGVEVEDVVTSIFGNGSINNFSIFGVIKLWKGAGN